VLFPQLWDVSEVRLTSAYANYEASFPLAKMHDRNEQAHRKTDPFVSTKKPTHSFELASKI
jgi:hypothetical protein